jgi:NADH-quinone oxidoreductase subunit J
MPSLLATAHLDVAQNVAFGLLAAAMAVGAVRVVTTKNIVHAALWLVVVLAGVAGIYVLLAAEFAAVVQIIVYIGAIVVLFLFGIMLTRAPLGRTRNLDNNQRLLALVVALFLLGLLGYVLVDSFHSSHVDALHKPVRVGTTALVGDAIFRTYLVPFEAVSVLLLAALVGAVVLARRD